MSVFDNGSKKPKSVKKKQKQAFKKHVKMLKQYEKDFDKRLKQSSADEMAESNKYSDTYKKKKK